MPNWNPRWRARQARRNSGQSSAQTFTLWSDRTTTHEPRFETQSNSATTTNASSDPSQWSSEVSPSPRSRHESPWASQEEWDRSIQAIRDSTSEGGENVPDYATVDANYWTYNNESTGNTYWVRSADCRGAHLCTLEWMRMVWGDQPPVPTAEAGTHAYTQWCNAAWQDMVQRIAASPAVAPDTVISDAPSVYDRMDHWRLFVESQQQGEGRSVPLLDPDDAPLRPRRRRRQGRGLCILRQERARCPNDCPCRTRTRPRRQRGSVDGDRAVEFDYNHFAEELDRIQRLEQEAREAERNS